MSFLRPIGQVQLQQLLAVTVDELEQRVAQRIHAVTVIDDVRHSGQRKLPVSQQPLVPKAATAEADAAADEDAERQKDGRSDTNDKRPSDP